MDAIVLAEKSLWEQIPTVVTQLPTTELIYVILFLPVLVGAFARRISTFCCAVLLASVAVIAILNPAHLPFVTALGPSAWSSSREPTITRRGNEPSPE